MNQILFRDFNKQEIDRLVEEHQMQNEIYAELLHGGQMMNANTDLNRLTMFRTEGKENRDEQIDYELKRRNDDKTENHAPLYKDQSKDSDLLASCLIDEEVLIKCENQSSFQQQESTLIINNPMLNDSTCEIFSSQNYSKCSSFNEYEEHKNSFVYDDNAFDQLVESQTIGQHFEITDTQENTLKSIDSTYQMDCSTFDQNLNVNSSVHSFYVDLNSDSISSNLSPSSNGHCAHFYQSTYYDQNCDEHDRSASQTIYSMNESEGVIDEAFNRINFNNIQLEETLLQSVIVASQADSQNNLEFSRRNKIILIANDKISLNNSTNSINEQPTRNEQCEKIALSPNSQSTNQKSQFRATDNASLNHYLILSMNRSETLTDHDMHSGKSEKQTNLNYGPANSSIRNSSDCLSSLYSLTTNLNQYASSTSCPLNPSAHKTFDKHRFYNEANESKPQTKSLNPFSPECRIPIPGTSSDQNVYIDNKNFIKRRNQRERIRVRSVNDGFENLRKHLPSDYEQYLEMANTNCYLNESNNSISSTRELDFKNSMQKVLENNFNNDIHLREVTFLDHDSVNNQFDEQNSINCSNSSSSSISSSTASNGSSKEKRLSKVETLRLAINYIKHLQSILNSD